MATRTKHSTALDVCVNGLLIALTLVATMFINIRLPISVNGGLIHLGNVPLVVAAIVFGKRSGAIAGAFGMGLFDLLSGWTLWAPFTFVVRGAMGFIIGFIAGRKGGKSVWLNTVAVVIGCAVMVVGYYFTEAIIYGNIITPVTSVPGNLVQAASAVVIGVPLATAMRAKLKLGR
ncbi:MAG: ECF transporter S component [Oscillospiraceae bacterium]|nr:ECF transporter S component [Oscillospiraceae bacterium]